MRRIFSRVKLKKQNKPFARLELTLQDVREAINQYEATLAELGLNRTVLIQDDHQINFELMASFLGGIPTKKFYMSRETYEVFEEQDKYIPFYLDMVQRAVDDYIIENNKLPVIDNCCKRRVNFDLLIHNHHLKEKPIIPIFISDQQDLVTHNENWCQN
jgi:Protein of unknown function (DUF3939)